MQGRDAPAQQRRPMRAALSKRINDSELLVCPPRRHPPANGAVEETESKYFILRMFSSFVIFILSPTPFKLLDKLRKRCKKKMNCIANHLSQKSGQSNKIQVISPHFSVWFRFFPEFQQFFHSVHSVPLRIGHRRRRGGAGYLHSMPRNSGIFQHPFFRGLTVFWVGVMLTFDKI